MVKVSDTWQQNVEVFTHEAAIQWKASQEKDKKKLKSENSEDALTWQFFRSIESLQLNKAFTNSFLGLDDPFDSYYWQRLPDHQLIDSTIDKALAELEPIHRKMKRQHTETDLMLRGLKNLIMVEVKLGYQRKEIDGWLQAKSSPVVQAYQPHAMPLMNNPDTWRLSVERFAQLYKNLMLGRLLAKEWSNTEDPLLVHLLVIVNGETKDKNGRTYLDEFELFRQGCSLPQNCLHFVTWQQLRLWIDTFNSPQLEWLRQRLHAHPLL